jgi:hypothetical protein
MSPPQSAARRVHPAIEAQQNPPRLQRAGSKSDADTPRRQFPSWIATTRSGQTNEDAD